MSAVHLARFGNRNNAHTLLEHTGADPEVLGQAVWHSDLPPHGPERVEPFVSGYPLGDLYVVQVTKPDESATRPGMVSTTAAFIPLDVLPEVMLDSVLARLSALPPLRDAAQAPDAREFAPTDGDHVHPDCAGAVLSALSRHRRVIFTGGDLAPCLSCLWRHMARSDLARLTFGTAYHPDAVPVPTSSDSLVVLSVPERLATRWTDWTVAAPTAADDPVRLAMFGGDDGRSAELASQLLDGEATLEQWRYIAALRDLVDRFAELSHEQTRSVLQLAGRLAPLPTAAADFKQRAFERLRRLTSAATFADVRGLRGVPWDALPASCDVQSLLTEWAVNVAKDGGRGPDLVAALAEVTTAGAPTDGLIQALDATLRGAVHNGVAKSHLSQVLIHARGADLLGWLRKALPRHALDDDLADSIPGSTPAWLPEFAAKNDLPRTHAAAVDVTAPVDAWRAHITVKHRNADADAVLAGRAGARGTVQAALQLPDAALTELAAELVAGDPTLLPAGDILDERFRAVWQAAVRRGANPWQHATPKTAGPALLELLVDGTEVDEALLDAVSRTAAADLCDFHRRSELWDRLPAAPRARMLTATAHSLGRRLTARDPIPEPVLASAILDPAVLGSIARDDADQALRLIGRWPNAGGEQAVIVADRGSFTPQTSAALGELVRSRGWRRAAESIVDLARSRPDLRAAATHVSSLFGVVERIRRYMGLSDALRVVATRDDLRDAVHELACALYPAGPADGAVWERAGGDPADLPDASTPRKRWGLALHAVEAGHTGAPPLDRLLDTMLNDYPKNTDLASVARALQEDRQ